MKPGDRSAMWRRVQGVSALGIACFTVPHLANSALALLGPGTYDGFQGVVRAVYQHPALEPLLLSAIAAHLVAWRMQPAAHTPGRKPLWRRLHRYSGLFIATFIVGHVGACRFTAGGAPHFNGLAYVSRLHPYVFPTYLILLGIAGVVHTCYGLPAAFRLAGVSAAFPHVPGPVVAVFAAAVAAGAAAIGGWLWPVSVDASTPYAQHIDKIEKAMPF